MTKQFRFLSISAGVLYFAMTTLLAGSAHGQTKSGDFVVAVSDVLWSPRRGNSPTGIAMVIRDLRASNDVVILKASNADPVTLAVALDALENARKYENDATRPLAIITVEPEGRPGPVQRKMSDARRAELQSMLNEIAKQSDSAIGTFGRGRWVLFHRK